MPKQISESELDTIKQAVNRFDEGASIDDIQGVLELKIPRRTLQRRLALLVERMELLAEGAGRGSKYRLAPVRLQAQDLESTAEVSSPALGVYVPVSKEGEQIKQLVRQAIQQRKPVGYKQDFLKAYRPNKTYYLSRL